MKFQFTEDQATIVSGLDQLLGSRQTRPGSAVMHSYDTELDRALAESGFIDIARENGFGPLDAALVIERVARLETVVEVAASALVGPLLPAGTAAHPLALVEGDGRGAARFLTVASALVVLDGDEAWLVAVEPGDVEPVDSLLAYPYGRLRWGAGAKRQPIANAAAVRRRWRTAIAAEAAGCMAAALELMLGHVKARYAFGRPLGSLQAIQHRLAMAAETVESTKWLAFRAAWSDDDADAALAAGFAQGRIAQFTYDLHQFAGAMGLTLEFPLHLWTYRLRALAGELGGSSQQARALAASVWAA